MKPSRTLAIAIGAAASVVLTGCGNSSNLNLRANQQVSYTARVQGNATVKNTGYTPVTIVKQTADTGQVLTIGLQPDNKQDHYLEPGSRLTIISTYNLPAELQFNYSSNIAESLTKEGPGPASPPQ